MADIINDLEIVKRRIERLNGFGEEAEVIDNVISLLKAQEPRVLTIEEVEALEEGTIVWVEENYGGQMYLNPMVCNGDRLFGNYYLGIDLDLWLCDGKKRFWTSKPTKEQSEATPWAEPPKEIK